MKTISLNVEGMKCGGCAKKIESGLEEMAQGEVHVDHTKGSVELNLAEGVRTIEVKKAIESLGAFKVISFEQK